MHAYKYDQATREYVGTCPLVPNPRRPDAPCLPAFATLKPVPEDIPSKHVARYIDEVADWEAVEDHRDTPLWRKDDKSTFILQELGPIPADCTTLEPGQWDKWDEATQAWMPDLEALRQAKFDRIHAEKCRARDAGFEVNGVLFDSDLAARTAYAELALALQQDPAFSTRWRASDGQWVTMDATLFADVHAAGRAHIESCFAWQEAREQEIAAATTLVELEAVSESYTVPA